MSDLREQLETAWQGRVCFVGLGNPDYGDDGLGMRLARELLAAGLPDVVLAGSEPERYLGEISDREFDHVVFLDAVEFGGEPGSLIFLTAREIESRFPQVSTHKISLALLAGFIETNGHTHVWLLGVQPGSLREGRGLTPMIQRSVEAVTDLLLSVGSARGAGAEAANQAECV